MKTFDEVMQLTHTISSATALEHDEARALYECLCEVPERHLVVEIGCQLGRSSSVIAQVAADRNLRTVYIDPYIENPEYLSQWVAMMEKAASEFAFLRMKSADAAKHVSTVDLLFVDGDHSYDAVLADLTAYCPKIRYDGFLVCHDYNRASLPDVKRAVDEYIGRDWSRITVSETLGVWRKK
jgi:cephalosporin hydroxylase